MNRTSPDRGRSGSPRAARGDNHTEQPSTGKGRWSWPVAALVVLGGGVLLSRMLGSVRAPASLSYSAFLQEVAQGRIRSVSLDPQGVIDAVRQGGSAITTTLPVAIGDPHLMSLLARHHVIVNATASAATGPAAVVSALVGLLPILLILGLLLWSSRAMRGQLAGMAGLGRSRARLMDPEHPVAGFDDVAGYAGAKREIIEVVDYLQHPERYARIGAVGPRGVLMVGPPGTGKTLLAKAVAGEAGVPFFSVTGSSFVEMFVGMGAARVRDLFAEVRAHAPAILFIDEIDAVGQRRSGNGLVGNDEREQTVNELLAAMDGFDSTHDKPIVVLAATNRPQALDVALLRPGRFDRQVLVPLPTQAEREVILGVHTHAKRLGPDVDLARVARGTPGLSGADLANLVNEAAILAVRAERDAITAADFDEAQERVQLGRRDEAHVLLPEEQHAVAVHESGHALVAALSPHADPVAKVTILPAGLSLGATHQLPDVERHLQTEGFLNDQLAVYLGGRVAEQLLLGETSSGAASDLQGATLLATRMVRELGMSQRLGPVGYAENTAASMPTLGRSYAEATQRLIDEEVAALLHRAERRATDLLSERLPALEYLVGRLMQEETVDGAVVRAALQVDARIPSGR